MFLTLRRKYDTRGPDIHILNDKSEPFLGPNVSKIRFKIIPGHIFISHREVPLKNVCADNGIFCCAKLVSTFVKHMQVPVDPSPFDLSPLVGIGDSSNVLHDILAGFSLSCSTFP